MTQIVVKSGVSLKTGEQSLTKHREKKRHLVVSANVTVIGISEAKPDGFLFNSEVVIKDYDVLRLHSVS